MEAETGWRIRGPEGPWTLEALLSRPGPRTTLRIDQGRVVEEGAHWARLEAGLACLGHDPRLTGDRDGILHGLGDGIVRIRLVPEAGVLLVKWEPWSAAPQPYRLLPLPHPLGDLRPDPRARHKGLLGNWSEAGLARARAAGAEDVLCLWPDGTVAETAIAAIALRDGATLRCPPPEGRVASIAEAAFLPGWAERRGLVLRTGPVTLDEARAGGLVSFNAARGVWQAEVLPSAAP